MSEQNEDTPEVLLADMRKDEERIHSSFVPNLTDSDLRTMLHNAALRMGDYALRMANLFGIERFKRNKRNVDRFVCESDALYAFMNECQLEDGEDIHTAFERWLFRPIDGMERLLPNGKKLLNLNYRLERSRNNGQFWGKLFGNETDNRIVIKSRMDVEHSRHPSDWLRIVKTVESVEDEILGNKRKDK